MLDARSPAAALAVSATPAEPFAGLALTARDAALTVAPIEPRARFVLRGGPEVAVAAAVALGCALPEKVGGVAVGAATVLKLGPDEWRLAGPLAEGPALRVALAGALAGVAHALTEVSDRDCGVRIEGAAALEALACGCPLDLAARPCPWAGRTLFGQLDALVVRVGPQGWEVEVWRSYADHLALHLTEIAAEIDLGV